MTIRKGVLLLFLGLHLSTSITATIPFYPKFERIETDSLLTSEYIEQTEKELEAVNRRFLDEEMNMLSPVPGYQKPDPFLNIAKYFGNNIYKDKDWKTYTAKSK